MSAAETADSTPTRTVVAGRAGGEGEKMVGELYSHVMLALARVNPKSDASEPLAHPTFFPSGAGSTFEAERPDDVTDNPVGESADGSGTSGDEDHKAISERDNKHPLSKRAFRYLRVLQRSPSNLDCAPVSVVSVGLGRHRDPFPEQG